MNGEAITELKSLLETTLYFLALLNPTSKILFLSTRCSAMSRSELHRIAWRATMFAFGILLLFCIFGNFLLLRIFRVELYALKLAGGLVLLFTGMTAVQKGVFFQHDANGLACGDISVVPLAAPLIAGPGTIAMTVSLSLQYGIFRTLLPLAAALLINAAGMLASRFISRLLASVGMIEPLIRLTGLLIMAIAMQVMLSGAAEWLQIAL